MIEQINKWRRRYFFLLEGLQMLSSRRITNALPFQKVELNPSPTLEWAGPCNLFVRQ